MSIGCRRGLHVPDILRWHRAAVPSEPLTAIRAIGCAGSALIALGGIAAGALPVRAGAGFARPGLV